MPDQIINMSRMNIGHRHGPVFFGDVTYRPGGECGPRIQQDYQLVFLRGGSLDLRLDDAQAVSVPIGSAILLKPGHREHFRFAATAPSQHAWCAVQVRSVPAKLRAEWEATPCVPVPTGELLGRLLEMGLTLPGEANGLVDGYYIALGTALCCEAARLARLRSRPRPSSGDAALARMRAFAQRELARPLSLEDLARAAGVSRQYLLKLHRDQGLPTPMDILWRLRLERAQELLAHTGLTIAEVADRAGFTNPYHFSRKFSAVHGASPRAWRQALWQSAQM